MSTLKKLFYVSRRQKLPRLRHHLTNGRKLDTPDDESEILMEAGIARDWSGARSLIKSKRKSAVELFWLLSKKPRANWKRRLRFWIIGIWGGYTRDPHGSEMRDLDGYDSHPYS